MEQAIQFLQQLSDKLGATGGALFELYSKKILAEGISDMMVGFVLVAGLIVAGFKVAWVYGWIWSGKGDSDDRAFATFMFSIAVLFIGLGWAALALTTLQNGIIETIAPQGVAVERIVHGSTKK